MADLAKILIYGDIHLSSKNYGAHNDYSKESLHYFSMITEKVKELGVTHLIGTGDFTFGRFNTLEYRDSVERELREQFKLVNGNRYEVKGNHDSATYGMTEYEYYVKQGLLKASDNFKVGNVNISLVNHDDYNKTSIIKPDKEEEINVVVAHNYFKFKDTRLPDYGKSIELDSFTDWFGVDYLIVGHIHNHHMFDGLVVKDGYSHPMVVHYLGSLSRPSYREGHTDEVGNLVMLTIRDNGEMQYDIIDIPLWSLGDSFNLGKKEIDKEKKLEREQRIDVSDIVQQLNSRERTVGNPEDIIQALEGLDEKYKKRAIEYLKLGEA